MLCFVVQFILLRFAFFFFFFKQKTAYEIGTGDWSSDVCSSDLTAAVADTDAFDDEEGEEVEEEEAKVENEEKVAEEDRKSVV